MKKYQDKLWILLAVFVALLLIAGACIQTQNTPAKPTYLQAQAILLDKYPECAGHEEVRESWFPIGLYGGGAISGAVLLTSISCPGIEESIRFVGDIPQD